MAISTPSVRTHTKGPYLAFLFLRFLLLLRLLGLCDGVQSRLCSHLFRLIPLRDDGGHVQALDTSLVLDGAARALLRNLLGNALLVHPAVHYGPCYLARVLALQEEGLVF